MSGEITRAILTEKCRSRLFRVYTVRFDIGVTPVTSVIYQMLQILTGTYFLWMGTNVYQFGGAIAPPSRTPTFHITNSRSGSTFSTVPATLRSMASLSLVSNWDNSTQAYTLLNGEDTLTIGLSPINANQQNSYVYFILSGMEYRL